MRIRQQNTYLAITVWFALLAPCSAAVQTIHPERETLQLPVRANDAQAQIVLGKATQASDFSRQLAALLAQAQAANTSTATKNLSISAKSLASTPTNTTPTASELSQLRSAGLSRLRSAGLSRGEHGAPRQFKTHFKSKRLVARALSTEDLHKVAASDFLTTYKEVLRINDPSAELTLSSVQEDERGRHYVRYQQNYQSIPVWPSELIVQLDAQNQVDLFSGYHIPTPTHLATQPSVTREFAIRYAVNALNDSNLEVDNAQLIIYASANRPTRLAWRVQFTPTLTTGWTVLIDAMHGTVLDTFNDIHHQSVTGSGQDLLNQTRPLQTWFDSGKYYLIDTSKPMYNSASQPPVRADMEGAIIIENARNLPATSTPTSLPATEIVNSTDINSWDAQAVSAAYTLSEAYDYFYYRHSATHVVDATQSLTAIVNFGQGYNNAFWQPDLKLMIFGNGQNYAASLDIVAHELSHAVINKTNRLVYQGQSGAISEGLADVFAEAAEARTYGVADWLIGSQLSKPSRNLANPASINMPGTTRPYPASMAQYVDPAVDLPGKFKFDDFGGVHLNSTIIGHAFYLLATSIDMIDAERIFYDALVYQIPNYAQFIDFRLGAIAAAGKLFGEKSAQAIATANAFTSVGILDGEASTPEPPTPEVTGADSVLFIDGTSNHLIRYTPSNNQKLELTSAAVAMARPSVSGGGEMTVYLSENRLEVCVLYTETATLLNCISAPSQVNSIALSPDKTKIAYVLAAQPSTITLVDAESFDTIIELPVTAPTSEDQTVQLNTVKEIGDMIFSRSGENIFFNARNEMTYTDTSTLSVWSIYSVKTTTGQVNSVIPPIKGLDFQQPSLGKTSDRYLTFTAYDSVLNDTFLYAADLDRNTAKYVSSADIIESPSYNGNDSAIIFSEKTGTNNYRILRQNLSLSDHITWQGTEVTVLGDSNSVPRMSTAFRMGEFHGVNSAPVGSIDELSVDGLIIETAVDGYYHIEVNDAVQFSASATDAEGDEITYTWRIYDLANKLIGEAFGAQPDEIVFPKQGEFVVKLIATDLYGATDPAPAEVYISVSGGNLAPIASITSPVTATLQLQVGQTVQFEGSGNDPDGKEGDALTYLWVFDDQAPSSQLVKPAPVMFNTVGEFTVSFTVTDALGKPSIPTLVTVIVREEDPSQNQPILNDSKPKSSDDGGIGGADNWFVLMLMLVYQARRWLRATRAGEQNG